MKIEYDIGLYKKIANLGLDEIVVSRNKKGKKTVIHITNITQLSWHELQLLISEGQDRFSKMYLLYKKHIDAKDSSTPQSEVSYKGERLSASESKEINEYIIIYKNNGCTKHHEANLYITNNNMWDNFPTMRSLNDHGDNKKIKGILPKYFEIICAILGIRGEKGLPLDKYTHY